MTSFLRQVAEPVRRAPAITIAVIVALTIVFGAFISPPGEGASDFEAFATDTPAAATADRVDELFGAATSAEIAQLAVVDADGDVLGPDTIADTLALIATIQSSEAVQAAAIQTPEAPFVSSYAGPLLGAAAAQGIDVTTLDDDGIDQLYTAALTSLPAEQAAQVSVLLGGDVDGADATAGMVLVFLDPAADADVLAAARSEIHALSGTTDSGVEVYSFDFTELNVEANETVQTEMGTLLAAAFGLIILILVAIYRRVSDVLASLLGLVITIVWLQGIGGIFGPDHLGWTGGLTDMSQAIPILLIGLGVDYGIHLTMRAREERANGADPAEAASRSIGAVGSALALATLTTVVGFLTNVANPLPPLQDFGIMAAVGVVAAFIVMTTFVPSMRLLIDRRRARKGTDTTATTADPEAVGALGRLSASFAPIAVRRPGIVLAVAAVLALGAGGLATQISTEFSQTDFFPAGSRALETVEVVTESFGGGLDETTTVLVEGDVTTAAADEAFTAFATAIADVPDVRSFEGLAQIEITPNADGTAALLQVQTSAGEAAAGLADALTVAAEDTLVAADLEANLTSEQLVVDEILGQLRDSQVSGLVITLVASMLILAFAFWARDREPLLGVLAIASVGITTVLVFGLMVILGIPFNVMTAMVSALAIGIGVPFGIHVVNRFQEDRRERADVADAMHHTLAHTGGALIGSALTTVAGFGVLVLSSVPPMRQFGIVTAMTIALALVTSLTVLPAMLALYARRGGAGTVNGDLVVELDEKESVTA